jgi:hypothetical protein
MRRILTFLLLACAGVASAEPGYTTVSSTSTATTTTLSNVVTTLCFKNSSSSANEAYVRVFTTAETPAAATTASILINAGESICLTHNTRTETGTGYIGYSIVCDTAETATVGVIRK